MNNIQHLQRLTNSQLARKLYQVTCITAGLIECQKIDAPYAVEILLDKLDEDTAFLSSYFEELASANEDQTPQQTEEARA